MIRREKIENVRRAIKGHEIVHRDGHRPDGDGYDPDPQGRALEELANAIAALASDDPKERLRISEALCHPTPFPV